MDWEWNGKGLLVPKRELIKTGGFYRGWITRKGKVINAWEDHNIVVYQGLDTLLSVMFTAAPQITTWYLGIYQGNYAPQATDTANTIPGNSTESTAYTNGTRVAYTATEGSQQTTNASNVATFNMNAQTTIYGAFLISSSGKGATSGVLFSATQFSSPKTVSAGDALNLTYVVGATSS